MHFSVATVGKFRMDLELFYACDDTSARIKKKIEAIWGTSSLYHWRYMYVRNAGWYCVYVLPSRTGQATSMKSIIV